MELTPDDFTFPVPKYVTWDRRAELKDRLDKMNEIISHLPPKVSFQDIPDSYWLFNLKSKHRQDLYLD